MMQQERQKKGREETKRNYEGGKIGKKSRTHLSISLHRGVCKGKRSKRANHHSERVIGSGIDLINLTKGESKTRLLLLLISWKNFPHPVFVNFLLWLGLKAFL
jgi:hypothetical protein